MEKKRADLSTATGGRAGRKRVTADEQASEVVYFTLAGALPVFEGGEAGRQRIALQPESGMLGAELASFRIEFAPNLLRSRHVEHR